MPTCALALHPGSAWFLAQGRRVTSGSSGSPPLSCAWLCANLLTPPPALVPPRVATSPFPSVLGWPALGGAAAPSGLSSSSDCLEQGLPRGLAEPHLSLRGKPRPAPRRRQCTLPVAAFQPIGRPVRSGPALQLLGKFSARRNLPASAAPLRAGPALELRGARPGSTLRRPARRRGAAARKPYELSRKGVTKGTAGRGPSRPVPLGGAYRQQNRGAVEDELAVSGDL